MPIATSQYLTSFDLSNLNGVNGLMLNGLPASHAGYSVASLGDINGDSLDDIIIGAPYANQNTGQCIVIFGSRSFRSSLPITLSSLNGNNGFVINGINPGSQTGYSVASAGDVNNDNISDILIGAAYANNGAGQSYVVFGSRVPWQSIFSLASLNGTNGFVLNGINANDLSGFSVASAGDVNGDGINDIIIGASGANNNAGQSIVVFGNRNPWPAQFGLFALNGTNGFVVNGINPGDQSGSSVASAGDVNGDGLADLLIGAPYANNNIGQSYVLFGNQGAWAPALNLASFNGANGFVLNGINSSDNSGYSIASADDVNGDGINDLTIGAPRVNNGTGQTYVVFGHHNPWDSVLNLNSLNGTNGFVLNGINSGDNSGNSVASAGDVNGDGIDDIIVGAPNANNRMGQSYVVFGRQGIWASTLSLASLNGTNGFVLNGINSGDNSGTSVASAGDVNGDGLSDLIIGAPDANNQVGQSYVIFSSPSFNLSSNELNVSTGGSVVLTTTNLLIQPIVNNVSFTASQIQHGQFEFVSSPGSAITGFTQSQLSDRQVVFYHDGSRFPPSYSVECTGGLANIGARAANITFYPGLTIPGMLLPSYALSSLNGINGFVLNGNSTGQSGTSVASAGDVNNDGLDDLIIGAPSANNGAGQSYVLFGNQGTWVPTLSLASLNGMNGFVLNGINSGDNSGNSVASVGDINGDRISDIIIGAPNANNGAGQSYVVFGSQKAWAPTLNLASLNGTNGFVLNGNSGDTSGSSVASAGDVNGDEIDDLIIGAPNTRQSYVVFGSQKAWAPSLSLASLNGTNGFILSNGGDKSGWSVASLGDVNGDGLDDIIIGAPGAINDDDSNTAGQSYVVFGNQGAWVSPLSLASLNGTSGVVLRGINSISISSDDSGWSVASAGDVNGDGLVDIIIGAPGVNYLAGQSYVVFGQRGSWPAILYLSALNGSNGFALNGMRSGSDGFDWSGRSVASAGDINGDGLSDIIIGAPQIGDGAGYSVVVFGKQGAWAPTLNLASLNGVNGFVLQGGISGSYVGYSVASAGDVNGDGLSDLIIGAPQIKYNNVGQSYVVFGASYAPVQLPVNTLPIAQNQTVTVNKAMLSSRSFNYPRAEVIFSISDIQHGWFQSIGSIGNITTFTQNQIDTDQVTFVHDGSQYAPSYVVSMVLPNGLLVPSALLQPSSVNASFTVAFQIKMAGFTINENNQQIILSSQNIMAVNPNYPNISDPAATFNVDKNANGWFAFSNTPETIIKVFRQADIDQGKICFFAPCVNDLSIPSFVISTSNDRYVSASSMNGSVIYNAAPTIKNNNIPIIQGQAVTLTSKNILAIDSNGTDPSIVFTVTATGGYFQFVGGRSNIINFTQANISDHQVEFVSDAMIAPSYNITATDLQGATSLPKAGQVTFQQSSASSTNNAITSTIAASVAIGGVAATGLGLFLLNRRNNNRLHDYIAQASNKDNSLNKVAEVIFEKIKLTGFLNHIQKNSVTEYVNAIKEILEALTAMNFPVDLSTMTEKSRNHFLTEFPRQIKGAFPVSQQSKMQFFKAEITSRQIKSQANHIAMSIKNVMDQVESQILDDDLLKDSGDIPLTNVSSQAGDRPDGLHELLMQDGDDSKKSRVSKCCVM